MTTRKTNKTDKPTWADYVAADEVTRRLYKKDMSGEEPTFADLDELTKAAKIKDRIDRYYVHCKECDSLITWRGFEGVCPTCGADLRHYLGIWTMAQN